MTEVGRLRRFSFSSRENLNSKDTISMLDSVDSIIYFFISQSARNVSLPPLMFTNEDSLPIRMTTTSEQTKEGCPCNKA